MNLDLESAKAAHEIITKTKESQSSEVENIITKTLGVLQENGVYACILFLYSRKSDSDNVVRKKLLEMTKLLGHKPENRDEAEYVLKFLTDNISGMMKSLEERNKWIERLYQIAVTNRGEAFLERIVEALSEALGLRVLIVRPLRDEGRFQTVAFSSKEAGNEIPPCPVQGLPCQQIMRDKTPLIVPSEAFRRFSSARCLSETRADTS